MSLNKTTILSLLVFIVLPLPAHAQTFSFDGNRWYEIEVSIFSNENYPHSNELVIPEKVQLNYLQAITQLAPASKLYSVDFEKDNTDVTTLSALTGVVEAIDQGIEPKLEQTAFIGPPNNPGDGNFTITDFNREPFIALGNEEASFLEYNLDISESADHRLLFHAVWRQPVLNRVQATAVYVEGGSIFNKHHELEGSLRFSYNVNRVDVEARIWLSKFGFSSDDGTKTWDLPDSPFAENNTQTAEFFETYAIEQLAYMDQERAMISNELHFLDHPNIGLLVEIRPYQLPEQNDFFD